MDLVTLEIFCLVAEGHSISGAAKQLNRVQSNITTKIQQLEEELGVNLFDRHSRRLQLSDQGKTYLKYAQHILALANEAKQTINPTKLEGIIRIGSMESTCASRLPVPLSKFNQHYPDVKVKISTNTSKLLIEQVHERHLDCAFVALPQTLYGEILLDLAELGLEGKPLFDEELMLIFSNNQELAQAPINDKPKNLAAFKMGCTYRSLLEDWMIQEKQIEGNIYEVGSYHAMYNYVSAGQCISAIPLSVIHLLPQNPSVCYVPLKKIPTWLVWRKDYNPPSFQAFLANLTTNHD